MGAPKTYAFWVQLDLGPEALHVDVERLGVAHVVGAPHAVDERLAREHVTRVGVKFTRYRMQLLLEV